jgi:hypothetical protein
LLITVPEENEEDAPVSKEDDKPGAGCNVEGGKGKGKSDPTASKLFVVDPNHCKLPRALPAVLSEEIDCPTCGEYALESPTPPSREAGGWARLLEREEPCDGTFVIAPAVVALFNANESEDKSSPLRAELPSNFTDDSE